MGEFPFCAAHGCAVTVASPGAFCPDHRGKCSPCRECRRIEPGLPSDGVCLGCRAMEADPNPFRLGLVGDRGGGALVGSP